MSLGIYLVRREWPLSHHDDEEEDEEDDYYYHLTILGPELSSESAQSSMRPNLTALATRPAHQSHALLPCHHSLPPYHECHWTAMPHPCLASDSHCSSRISELN